MSTETSIEELNELFKQLTASDASDRRMAAEDLGGLGDQRAVPMLVHSLLDPVTAVREAVVLALKQYGFPETCRQMILLLSSELVPVRNAALEVLQSMAAEAAPMLLNGPLYALSSDLRKFSLDILSQAEDLEDDLKQRVVEKVLPMLDDTDLNVAAAAVEVLAQHGNEETVTVLVARLSGPIWLQCHIIQALAKLPGQLARESLARIEREALAPVARIFLTEALESQSKAA